MVHGKKNGILCNRLTCIYTSGPQDNPHTRCPSQRSPVNKLLFHHSEDNDHQALLPWTFQQPSGKGMYLRQPSEYTDYGMKHTFFLYDIQLRNDYPLRDSCKGIPSIRMARRGPSRLPIHSWLVLDCLTRHRGCFQTFNQ